MITFLNGNNTLHRVRFRRASHKKDLKVHNNSTVTVTVNVRPSLYVRQITLFTSQTIFKQNETFFNLINVEIWVSDTVYAKYFLGYYVCNIVFPICESTLLRRHPPLVTG